MNTRIIAAAKAVMVAAVMLAAGCGSAATSTPTPTPSPTRSVMSPAASSTSPGPSTSPSPSHSAPPPTPPTLPATTFPVAALLASCYPTTSSGHCYQPGQYCPKSDYGATGVAEDGTQIICQYNNGWRWEPVYGTTPSASPFPSAPPATGGGGTPGSRTPCCSGSAWRRCWLAPGAWPTAGGSPGNADQGSGRRTLPGADLRGLPGPPAAVRCLPGSRVMRSWLSPTGTTSAR